jgi:phosphoenolpyruvate carboxylase
VDGRFKVTEQGEVAFARYGQSDIARHHLEQLLTATADAPGAASVDPAERFAAPIALMDEASRTAYRALVETPGFARFFTQVTPIAQIAGMPVASRPVSRAATVDDLDALRAIPWVFAWAQTRVNLTGWFGVGSGLEAVAQTSGGMNRMRRMHREWAFFRTVLENVELALAKTDRIVASRYLERGRMPDIARAVMAEYDRTLEMLAAITGHEHPLDGRPGLQTALALRAPYVDALSLIQLRFASARGVAATRVVQATIGGVAAGLQNTG